MLLSPRINTLWRETFQKRSESPHELSVELEWAIRTQREHIQKRWVRIFTLSMVFGGVSIRGKGASAHGLAGAAIFL